MDMFKHMKFNRMRSPNNKQIQFQTKDGHANFVQNQ